MFFLNFLMTPRYAITSLDLALPELDRLGPQHQVREIDIPFMWWHIGTLGHVTHVTQVAMIDHIPVDLARHTVKLHGVGLVNGIKQGRKGVAQIEAAAAAMTDVKDALQFCK